MPSCMHKMTSFYPLFLSSSSFSPKASEASTQSVFAPHGQYSEYLDQLRQLDFNALSYNTEELIQLVKLMFYDVAAGTSFQLDMCRVENLIRRAQSLYQEVPYHSFVHAVDVCQYCYLLCRNEHVQSILSPLDVLCVITSALLHDLAHAGVNNALLQELHHKLVAKYPDSPLEEYHAHLATKLLSLPDCNILHALPHAPDRDYFLRSMRHIILSTDMKHHNSIYSETELRIAQGLDPNSADDRLLVMQLILKCGDLSNVTRSFDIARSWSQRVVEEFAVIGDLQKEAYANTASTTAEKKEIPKLFDRQRIDFPESQIGFLKFVARGQFSLLVAAFPSFQYILDQVNSNAQRWEELSHKKDDLVKQFEKNLVDFGDIIREPLDNVLDMEQLLEKPLDEITEAGYTETSLIQKRLLQYEEKNAEQGASIVYASSIKSRRPKSMRKHSESSLRLHRFVLLIFGATCCLSYVLYWRS